MGHSHSFSLKPMNHLANRNCCSPSALLSFELFSMSRVRSTVKTGAEKVGESPKKQGLNSHAVKASKPDGQKPKVVESNRARHKVGPGPQPTHEKRLQKCIEVSIPVNGLSAWVLLDGGSNMNMVSPEFATVAKIPAIELQEQTTLQLAVTGSRSKINYGAWAEVNFGPITPKVYFDIVNVDGYDVILGTPFMREHGVSLIFQEEGWVMKDGQRLDLECTPVAKSFRPLGHPPNQ